MSNSQPAANLTVNGARLWDSLMEMAKIGATPKGGVCRLALTDLDRQARDLFRQWCEAAGCTTRVDAMGNVFARRPGRDESLPAVATGSHLDTQPTGGKFDGIYGVLAGLEVVRVLEDAGIVTEAPIDLCVWTNEEGSRFPPAMIGSGVFAGVFDLEYGLGQTDHDGVTIGEALDDIGYRGDLPPGHQAFGAFFEVHIEQGPILENARLPIGVVTGVQGIRWYDLRIVGAEAHAGPTPMELRRDALAGAAAVLSEIYAVAHRHAPDGRATVGEFRVHPGSRNTIPGSVDLTIDLRHPDTDALAGMDQAMRQAIDETCARLGLQHDLEHIWTSPPVVFDRACVEAVRSATARHGYPAMDIVSGAGHDAVYVSRVAPTAMIFIPCEGGISHNEIENVSPDDVERGANVLLHALLDRAMSPAR